MPDHRRAPRSLAVFALAVPIVVAVYLTSFGHRLWSAFRPLIAAALGLGVIGSIYADAAARRALPAARVTPVRAALVAALAVTIVSAGIAPAPTSAGQPSEQVIRAARNYLGAAYRWGATGPNAFDCSGLMYRAFRDAGELPRISGKRLSAAGYMKWFRNRGLVSKKNPARGDLVVYNYGSHIGLYLGDKKVISSLWRGVSVHDLNGIEIRPTLYLKVDWSTGDGKADDGAAPKDDGDKVATPEATRTKDKDSDSRGGSRLPTGLATGTLNLRKAADPDARIKGWVSRGTTFKILGKGRSPSGALWFNVETRSGKTGWIWSHWTRVID
jgi:hypothetical protein